MHNRDEIHQCYLINATKVTKVTARDSANYTSEQEKSKLILLMVDEG